MARGEKYELKSTKTEDASSGQLLDTFLAEQPIERTAYTLREIMAIMGLKVCMKSFAVIAKDLSRIVHKDPPWTKKYIHSVYHEQIEISPLLAKAVDALAQMVDGTPGGVAGSVYVRVLAQPEIPEGVLIPASAKVIKCARPGCPVWFVKVHPRQEYHDPSCRLAPLLRRAMERREEI